MTSPFLRTFYAALISWSLLFVYLLAFYQSANTPLRAADLTEVLQTAALALAMSGAIAALIWLLGVLLGSIPHPDRLNTWLLRFAAGPVIFVLALMVVENWFYSLLGVGLKSGQNLWLKIKYKKYKWGVGSNGPSRKRSWRQEIVDVGSGSACGEYSHCWSCRSFSFTFETWHKQLHTNEFLSGFLAD